MIYFILKEILNDLIFIKLIEYMIKVIIIFTLV